MFRSMNLPYKIIIKLMVLLMPYFIFCPIMINHYPMKFMDGEYAYYKQNKDYSITSSDNPKILIMGDSTAKAAWAPEKLSNDTYNFSLGGVSPIEEFHYLRAYLQTHDIPQIVIYTQSVDHFINAETFWTRSMYFHRIKTEDLKELFQEIQLFEDKSIFGESILKESFFYLTYSPVKYSTAFVKGLLYSKRYVQNMEKYIAVSRSKGQMQFGTAECCDDVNKKYVDYDSFHVNSIIDHYFRKIIELCEEYHIQFVFQNPPINESTYTELNKQFVSDYESYLNGVGEDYSNVIIDSRLFSYENGYFGDSVHLNIKGTVKFSREMKEKYRDIFEEGEL